MRTSTAAIAAAIAALVTLQSNISANAQGASATEAGTDIGTFYKDEEAPLYKVPGYSPYAGRNYPTRVLWGDTHLHTANSLDAAAFGNTLGPEEAYRFARGEEVLSATGQRVTIREEVLYRTGLSLGLDKDDTIVRRRIRQKMDFVLEDTVGTPDDAELRAFFDAHADKFRVEPRIAFRQVFLSLKRSNPEAEALLPQLVASGPNVEGAGDPLLLPETFGLTPLSQIDAQFGEGIASELSKVAPGHWAGPLKSAYGFHLVLVKAIEPSRLPPFDEVRDAVQREWFAARRAAVLDQQYQKLQAKYHVRVEGLTGAPAVQ